MPCCGNSSNETVVEPLNKEDFDGPVKERSCRDVLCLLIFLIFIAGLIPLASMAFTKGNPYRLLYGVDSWGNVCNQPNEKIEGVRLSGEDTTDKKKTFYYDPLYFTRFLPDNPFPNLIEDAPPIIICVEACPNETLQTPGDVSTYHTETGTSLCVYDVITTYVADEEQCPSTPIGEHVSLFNRCIPKSILDSLQSGVNTFTSSFSDLTLGAETMEKAMNDIRNSWVEIMELGGIAAGVAFLIVILMPFIAMVIVWLLVFLVVALSTAAATYSWYTWINLKEEYEALPVNMQNDEAYSKVGTWNTYSIIATVIMVVIFLVLLVLRKRIGLVVQLFKEAGRVTRAIPSMLFIPFITLIVLILSLVVLGVISLYVETSGDPEVIQATGHVEHKFPEFWTYLRWYNLFVVLWITAFIVACQDMVIAGAVSIWYFKRDKSNLGYPLMKSIYRLYRYHLGSVAFGSFIIALVRFIRIVLGYIQRQLKGRGGKVAEVLLKMLQCCLWCFEKFIQFLNRNAYIEIAIYGKGFCESAKKALMVIVSNALRVAAINSIGDFVLFLGKLSTAAIVMVIGNELLKDRTDLNYYWLPISLACVFGFAVAHCFLMIYEITIDTLFVCFCEDCEINDGVNKPFYMSKNLMKYLDDTEKAEAARNQFQKKEDGSTDSQM